MLLRAPGTQGLEPLALAPPARVDRLHLRSLPIGASPRQRRRAAALGAGLSLACLRKARSRAGRRTWDAQGCELPPEGEGIPFAKPGKAKGQPAKVALLLNRNANGVNFKLERKLAEVVGTKDCFLCCSLEDAKSAVQEILDAGTYEIIACGGGDGTLASVLNLLLAEHKARGGAQVIPTLAVLRLGTGNALAYVLGSRRNAVADLQRLVKEGGTEDLPSAPAKLVALKAVPSDSDAERGQEPVAVKEESLCFFAGLGYDARMLMDYVAVKRKTEKSRLRSLVHSPFGYLVALFTRTLPATMRGEHLFQLRFLNMGQEAFYMDPQRGDWAVLKPEGSVLYEGEAGIVAMGAVPFYGGGFELFPFAGIPGFVHVRISNVHPIVATANIVPIWRGQYRNRRKVHDFLVKDALIEVDRPAPLQHSGDLLGEVKRLRVRVSEGSGARLVDFCDDGSKAVV